MNQCGCQRSQQTWICFPFQFKNTFQGWMPSILNLLDWSWRLPKLRCFVSSFAYSNQIFQPEIRTSLISEKGLLGHFLMSIRGGHTMAMPMQMEKNQIQKYMCLPFVAHFRQWIPLCNSKPGPDRHRHNEPAFPPPQWLSLGILLPAQSDK